MAFLFFRIDLVLYQSLLFAAIELIISFAYTKSYPLFNFAAMVIINSKVVN
jgi:hypothetical protein